MSTAAKYVLVFVLCAVVIVVSPLFFHGLEVLLLWLAAAVVLVVAVLRAWSLHRRARRVDPVDCKQLAAASLRVSSGDAADPSSDRWVPDQRTIDWCFGALYYRNLIDPIRNTTRGRFDSGEEFEWSAEDPAFWAVVSESAEESVLFELSHLAADAQEPTDPVAPPGDRD